MNTARSAVGPAHIMLGVGRQPTSQSNEDSGTARKKARKDKCPNWTSREVMVLVESKRDMSRREANCKDERELMIPEAGKWQKISDDIHHAGVSTSRRDGPSCKSKWNLLLAEYKRIVDFASRLHSTDVTYWNIDADERKSQGLPRSFSYDVFKQINAWNGNRPSIQPPHTRDLMSPHDKNFECGPSTPVRGQRNPSIESFEEDSVDSDGRPKELDGMSNSTNSRVPMPPTSHRSASPRHVPASPARSRPAMPRFVLPIGVTPVVISSSDTGNSGLVQCPGNTGVRRRSVSGQSLVAEATRATGDALTTQMKDMHTETNALERSRLEQQQRLYIEQMMYYMERDKRQQENRMERDRRLHEHAKEVNENSRLSIEKQGELVQCLSQLSTAITMGFQMRQEHVRPSPERAHPLSVTDMQVDEGAEKTKKAT